MSRWVVEGLRTPKLTTKYPRRPEEAAGVSPGLPVAAGSGAVCPTGALEDREGAVHLDDTRCVHCFRCRRAAAPAADWSPGFEWARFAAGADGVALSNSVLQALGCLGMRASQTNNCPVGIATQKPHLRQRLPVEAGARRVANFLTAATDLMAVMARACGHSSLDDFNIKDLTPWKTGMADLTGVAYGGVGKP